MKLTARQRKRRAYAAAQPRVPREPRPPRPPREQGPAKPVKPARRAGTLPPLFYFIFGAFGFAWGLYYLVYLIILSTSHHVDTHGKPIPPPGIGYYAIVLVFLAMSVGNVLIGLKVRRDRRAAQASG